MESLVIMSYHWRFLVIVCGFGTNCLNMWVEKLNGPERAMHNVFIAGFKGCFCFSNLL